jgi:hypothetical protein
MFAQQRGQAEGLDVRVLLCGVARRHVSDLVAQHVRELGL